MDKLSDVQSHARGLSSTDIVRTLEARIRNGEFAPGAQLPTVRELAHELGVNKNTVMRAYQALEDRGYLEVTQGRGAFVRASNGSVGADDRWRARLDDLTREARRRGLDRQRLLGEMRDGIDRVYGREGLRLAFVECNSQDMQEMGGELGQAVGQTLEGTLLADALTQPEELARRYDLIVTTFYHLGEMSRALGDAAEDKLVGVNAMPHHDALLHIARLDVAVIGLVTGFPGTAENLSHIVRTYHPTATILDALIDDEARLTTLLAKADAVVVTRSCYQRLMALHPTMPLIQVTYGIEQQSVDFLRRRVRALSAEA